MNPDLHTDVIVPLPNAGNEIIPLPAPAPPTHPYPEQPPVDNAHVAPGCQPFGPPSPVFCIVAPGGTGALMGPPAIGPLLTINFQTACSLAQENGGEVMEWGDAYPLLRAHSEKAPRPSLLVDASGRPANAEKKLIT